MELAEFQALRVGLAHRSHPADVALALRLRVRGPWPGRAFVVVRGQQVEPNPASGLGELPRSPARTLPTGRGSRPAHTATTTRSPATVGCERRPDMTEKQKQAVRKEVATLRRDLGAARRNLEQLFAELERTAGIAGETPDDQEIERTGHAIMAMNDVDLVATAYGLLLELDEHGDGERTGVPLGVRTPAGWMSCRMTLAEIANRWVPAHVWRAALKDLDQPGRLDPRLN